MMFEFLMLIGFLGAGFSHWRPWEKGAAGANPEETTREQSDREKARPAKSPLRVPGRTPLRRTATCL
jgi:hypothetical protein